MIVDGSASSEGLFVNELVQARLIMLPCWTKSNFTHAFSTSGFHCHLGFMVFPAKLETHSAVLVTAALNHGPLG